VNRETIYSALFQRLQTASDFVTCSRNLKHYSDVSPSEQPAIFVAQGSQHAEHIKGFPTKYTLQAKAWIYTNDPDPSKPPAYAINNILDQVDEVMKPDAPQDKQTLSGLVEDCWIDGEIVTDEGTLGDQSVAIFTIKILTTT